MSPVLSVRRWINIDEPHSVALSADGQLAAVGHEKGLVVFDATGGLVYQYMPPGDGVPGIQVRATRNFEKLFLLSRLGDLLRFSQSEGSSGSEYQPKVITRFGAASPNTLSIAADGNSLVVGFLTPALAVLNGDGKPLWAERAEERTATDRDHWSVAFGRSGQVIYAGSATSGLGVNYLAVIPVKERANRNIFRFPPGCLVTGVAALSKDRGVVAAILQRIDVFPSKLVALDKDLSGVIWEQEFAESITALTVDSEAALLVVSSGYEGRIDVLDAGTGKIQTQERPLCINGVVNELAMAQGSRIAAVTRSGELALIQYDP